MSHTLNNENDYKITRSKTSHKQELLEQDSQPKSHISNQIHTNTNTNSKNDDIQVNTRQYLADVSNQYGAASSGKPLKSSTISTLTNKRRPLGGDAAPLQQQQQPQSQQLRPLRPTSTNTNSNTNTSNSNSNSNSNSTNNIKMGPPRTDESNEIENKNNIPASSDIKNILPRLPQKRQATESSTNLVEKLHTQPISFPQPSSNNNQGTYKKARLIDYEWQDLDEEDADDPLMASEYVADIFTYFYELEQRMLPDSEYLFKQRHLKPKMRSILVDWLVEMHLKFRLLPESLFLAINIMDRFMSLEVVQIDKLQLLATGSLFIAAKYEEVFSPSVKNYAYFTDGSYTEEEILQAEKYILTILNFDLNYPNPMNFLRRISKADEYDVQSRTLGKYLLEVTAIDYKFIGFKPSLCCASAMYLSRLILGKIPIWNGNLIHYSGGYRVNDMKVCIELIFQYLISPVEHDEFFKKYATRKFMKASILCRSWAKKFHTEGKDLFDETLSTHRIELELSN
ncbi:G2/mitotic-specific cyclin [Scheffersomyces amazonensis]|uniref:G2/mitotic-specific cyclin n=1 Tax=Scheffersomyces amazonensis TaxID=1078765 RepID=UPI00315DC1FC